MGIHSIEINFTFRGRSTQTWPTTFTNKWHVISADRPTTEGYEFLKHCLCLGPAIHLFACKYLSTGQSADNIVYCQRKVKWSERLSDWVTIFIINVYKLLNNKTTATTANTIATIRKVLTNKPIKDYPIKVGLFVCMCPPLNHILIMGGQPQNERVPENFIHSFT